MDVVWNTVINIITRPVVILHDTFTSKAYLYPFFGIWYCLGHPKLWPFLVAILIPHLILLFIIFIIAFILIYPLQSFIFFIFQGPSAVYTSFVLVFQESIVITSIISDLFLFPAPSAYLFDAILISEGFNDFVLNGKSKRKPRTTFRQRMIKLWLYQIPWFFLCPWWFFEILLVIGLNMIPFIGPVLVIFVKAPTIGIKYHKKYFALKFNDPEMTKKFIYNNRGKYYGFGLTAAMCEMVPILGFIFKFTNVIGACLWSCDLIKTEVRLQNEIEASENATVEPNIEYTEQQAS